MAGTSTRQYNLRSGKQEGLQFPVQIQLSEDTEFLKTLLNHHDGQVSDSESSISEADCEALINDSPVDSFANVSKTSSPRDKKSISDPKNSDDMQQIINSKILTQLKSLGKRLDSIEQNVVSSNVSKNKSQKTKRKNCLSPSHTAPQASSHPASRFDQFMKRFISPTAGRTASETISRC